MSGTRISLSGVRGKNGATGTLLSSFGDGKWKVELDHDLGSAIVHESNLQLLRDLEGPVDQRTKDERTALRRAKIQEKRSQLLEKKAAKGQALEEKVATKQRRRTYYIAGSWNSWQPEEMTWSEEQNFFSSTIKVAGPEAFQVYLDPNGHSCLHSGDVPQRCPQGGVLVQGPDPKWRCEGFNFKMAKIEEGGLYHVRLLLDVKGFAKKIFGSRLPSSHGHPELPRYPGLSMSKRPEFTPATEREEEKFRRLARCGPSATSATEERLVVDAGSRCRQRDLLQDLMAKAPVQRSGIIRASSLQDAAAQRHNIYRAVEMEAEDQERTLEFLTREGRGSQRSKTLVEGDAWPLRDQVNQGRRATSIGGPAHELRSSSIDSPWWAAGTSPSSRLQGRYHMMNTRSSAASERNPSDIMYGSRTSRLTISPAPTELRRQASPAPEIPSLGRGSRGVLRSSVAPTALEESPGEDAFPDDAAAAGHRPCCPRPVQRASLQNCEGVGASPGARSEKELLTFWGRSDSISDERLPMMLAATSPAGYAADQLEAIELEPDFYALSLSPQASCWAAFCAPIISAIAQLAVLYFLAFQNENMFEGGKWKQPISPYGSREREGTTRRG
ncbi:unnamed protein product, partial [Durusdinium trenchii]